MSITNPVENQIKKIYLSIKNDDLASFKSFINKDKNLLFLKNNKDNNLLFYCLEKNSFSIFNYIYKSSPKLLIEKNTDGFNCLTNLINKKSLTSLKYFLENSNEDIKKKLINSYDINNNNLLVQFMKKGEDYYELYNKYFKRYDNEDSVAHINNEGQNIAHLIAYYDCGFSTSILESRYFNTLGQKDNKGVTPMLMAARHSSFDLFKFIADKSNLKETTDLDSNALHFSSYSGDLKKLDYLTVNGLDANSKNKYFNSPLSIALIEKKLEYSLELLKKVNDIDFEDLLYIIRASEKFSGLYSYIINNNNKLLSCMDTVEKKQKFFAHLFYYGTQKTIEESKKIIVTLFNNDQVVLNSLFFSSIAGRRDFLFKTNYLLNNFGWVNATNEIYNNFSKEQLYGYVYALYQLPKTQLEYLVKKSFVYENMNAKDKIIFRTISISKSSHLFSEKEKYDFNSIKNDTNLIKLIEKLSIDKIIDNIDFFEQLAINSDIKELLKNSLAAYIYKETDSVKALKIIYNKLKDKDIKKNIYLKLNEIFLHDNNLHALEEIFNNKFTIMENVLNNMLENDLENFNNVNYVINNKFINLSPKSCFRYIKENKFSKKSLEFIKKSNDFFNYLKNIDISSEEFLSLDFLKFVMNTCPSHEKSIYLNKFMEYSFSKENIHVNTYIYFYNQLNEKDQKLLIKTALPEYLKKEGLNIDTYNFLDKRYKQIFSSSSLDKHLLKSGTIGHLVNRLLQNSTDFNIFKSNYFSQFNKIDLLNKAQFDNNLNLLFFKIDNFGQSAIINFLNSSLEDKNLNCLSQIITMAHSNDVKVYEKVLERLECFITTNSNTSLFYQEIINNMLFNNTLEIQNLIVNSEVIKRHPKILTHNQRQFLFSLDLEDKLQQKNPVLKPVKL